LYALNCASKDLGGAQLLDTTIDIEYLNTHIYTPLHTHTYTYIYFHKYI